MTAIEGPSQRHVSIRLMYGPASGRTVNVEPGCTRYRVAVPQKTSTIPPAGAGLQVVGFRAVDYGPRPMSGRIWYPLDRREWYTGPLWDGFRPDGAPSPIDEESQP